MSKAIIDINHGPFISKNNLGGGSFFDPDAVSYFSTAGISLGAVTPSAYDQAASFNGTNQYLSVASNSSLQLGNGQDFTISSWINPTLNGNYLFGKYTSSTGWEYGLSTTNTSFLVILGSYVNTINYSFPLNQWSLITIVYNYSTTTLNVYVNGVSINVQTGVPTFANASAPFSIANTGDYTGGYKWNGSIAGFGIWTSASGGGGALSASQVSALYNKGIGLTYSVIANTDLEPNLVSYWALNETSGASVYVDSNEINNLTPYGTPTNSVGPIATSTLPTQNLINSFVKGTKQLGLWNSMVCWPLRSSQNASSTLTAQALGGFGNYVGTMTNFAGASSAWGSSGVNFNTAGYITANVNYNDYASSCYAIINPTSADNPVRLAVTNGAQTDNANNLVWASQIYSSNQNSISSNVNGWGNYGTSVNLKKFSEIGFNQTSSTTGINWINGTPYSASGGASVPSSATNIISIGAYSNGNYPWVGIIPFVAIFKGQVANYASLTNLYKSTLGVGLALL